MLRSADIALRESALRCRSQASVFAFDWLRQSVIMSMRRSHHDRSFPCWCAAQSRTFSLAESSVVATSASKPSFSVFAAFLSLRTSVSTAALRVRPQSVVGSAARATLSWSVSVARWRRIAAAWVSAACLTAPFWVVPAWSRSVSRFVSDDV